MDVEYGYDDPVLDEVSCNDEAHARLLAQKTNGRPWKKTWAGGRAISKEYV